jgi:hypothetical protein
MKGLDFKQFKKVSSDDNSTTLQHPKGHKIVVAHKALSPKMRGELEALELHMADGGQVPDKKPKEDKGPKINQQAAKDFEKGFQNSGGLKFEEWGKNLKNALGMANGGVVEDLSANSSHMPAKAPDSPDAIAADVTAAQPPASDPSLLKKRELYNQMIDQQMGNNIDPYAVDFAQTQKFGVKGEEPKSFNASAWTQAEQAYQTQQQEEAAKAQQAQAKLAQDNQARIAAGLAPIQPEGSQGPAPASQPPQGLAESGLASAQQPAAQPQSSLGMAEDSAATQQKAGIMAEAEALARQGRNEAKVLNEQITRQQEAMVRTEQHFAEIEKERQAFSQDLMNSHIDPNRFMANKSTLGKIATVIGLSLGGIG